MNMKEKSFFNLISITVTFRFTKRYIQEVMIILEFSILFIFASILNRNKEMVSKYNVWVKLSILNCIQCLTVECKNARDGTGKNAFCRLTSFQIRKISPFTFLYINSSDNWEK